MYNKEFMKYERLKHELNMISRYCGRQYFTVEKCRGNLKIQGNQPECKKLHVERCFYPCVHYYMGNCKYGFNCHFSHSIKRQIVRPDPKAETCKKFYYENYCPFGSKCKHSHDLREYPCVYNSLGKCKYSQKECRYSHSLKLQIPILCFFNLMQDCRNPSCENDHRIQNALKLLSYDGPL